MNDDTEISSYEIFLQKLIVWEKQMIEKEVKDAFAIMNSKIRKANINEPNNSTRSR